MTIQQRSCLERGTRVVSSSFTLVLVLIIFIVHKDKGFSGLHKRKLMQDEPCS